jgi:hypothetical protein
MRLWCRRALTAGVTKRCHGGRSGFRRVRGGHASGPKGSRAGGVGRGCRDAVSRSLGGGSPRGTLENLRLNGITTQTRDFGVVLGEDLVDDPTTIANLDGAIAGSHEFFVGDDAEKMVHGGCEVFW